MHCRTSTFHAYNNRLCIPIWDAVLNNHNIVCSPLQSIPETETERERTERGSSFTSYSIQCYMQCRASY